MKWFRVKYRHTYLVVGRLRTLEKSPDVSQFLNRVEPGEMFAVAICDVNPREIRFYNMLSPSLKQEEEISLQEGLEYNSDDAWPAWANGYATHHPGKKIITTDNTPTIDEIVDGIIANFDDARNSAATHSPIKVCDCPINHLGVLHTIECQPLPYSPWSIRQPAATLSNKEINDAHKSKFDCINDRSLNGQRARDDARRIQLDKLSDFFSTYKLTEI